MDRLNGSLPRLDGEQLLLGIVFHEFARHFGLDDDHSLLLDFAYEVTQHLLVDGTRCTGNLCPTLARDQVIGMGTSDPMLILDSSQSDRFTITVRVNLPDAQAQKCLDRVKLWKSDRAANRSSANSREFDLSFGDLTGPLDGLPVAEVNPDYYAYPQEDQPISWTDVRTLPPVRAIFLQVNGSICRAHARVEVINSNGEKVQEQAAKTHGYDSVFVTLTRPGK